MKHLYRVFLLVIFTITGIIVFQAQDINTNGDDPRFDQLPSSFYNFSNKTTPTNPVPMVITDTFGYDNFDIGVQNAEQWITQNPNNSFRMIFGVNTTAWYHTEDGLAWV